MRKRVVRTILVIATVGLVSCTAFPEVRSGADKPISLAPAFSDVDLAARFGSYFEPVEIRVSPRIPDYPLPLRESDIQNLGQVLGRIVGDVARQKLLANGFVSVALGPQDDVVEMYKAIRDMDIPVFVTTDSLLHLYHIQFDETLRLIEEEELYPDLLALSRALQAEMQSRSASTSGVVGEAYRKGLAYFTVGLKLLEPDTQAPASVSDLVDKEMSSIEVHSGFESSAIFTYREDYSQYVPRGHYTRSERLKRYFRAMMWYGRLTMLIKGHEDYGPEAHRPALVSPEEAQVQTLLGCAIAGLLGEVRVGDRSAAQVWERIYAVTAYYVGLADDLTPQDYHRALRAVFGERLQLGALASPGALLDLKVELAKLAPPAIYSGTGESSVNLDMEKVQELTPDQLDRILAKTQGFRMMGQRYVPDSYILGQMVAPAVGKGLGPAAFTTVMIPDLGPVRGFPRGLDVMAVLGSDRSLAVLEMLGDVQYEGYESQMKKLQDQFGTISRSDWNRNLYWSWLYALAGLIDPVKGEGWPTFMRTEAWSDKQLNAALGSWSSLRHDTILYAKQSYTATITTESAEPVRPEPPPVVGYVEPVPELYARLLALTRMSIKGLADMNLLDEAATGRLQSLERIIARLLDLSEKELRNEELSETDYTFIRNFGDNLSSVVTGAGTGAQKTTLVADVHTDQNTGQALEEATGYLRLLVVAYRLPQGHILIGTGPAFSYYEFKHPIRDRLTDEKWREMLGAGQGPGLPEWTASFCVH